MHLRQDFGRDVLFWNRLAMSKQVYIYIYAYIYNIYIYITIYTYIYIYKTGILFQTLSQKVGYIIKLVAFIYIPGIVMLLGFLNTNISKQT